MSGGALARQGLVAKWVPLRQEPPYAQAMSDAYSHMMESGLWEEIVHTLSWAKTKSISRDFEVFLNPADVALMTDEAEDLSGYTVVGLPLRQSIGVEPGKCMIFDRPRGKYIRRGEPVTD